MLRRPEAADTLACPGRVVIHVRRQLVRQPAHFATSHGIGLAGDRKGPGPRQANLAARQVAIDDRIALVGTTGGLVDALRVQSDHMQLAGKPVVEGLQPLFIDVAGLRDRLQATGALLGGGQRLLDPFGVPLQIDIVQLLLGRHPGQQPVEQKGVAAWRDAQVQIGDITGVRDARVHHHHTHQWITLLGDFQALIQHRVIPGQIGAHQHHQLGLFQVFILAGHGIRPEGTLVARYGRRHA